MAATKIFENLIALQIFEQIDATTKKNVTGLVGFMSPDSPNQTG